MQTQCKEELAMNVLPGKSFTRAIYQVFYEHRPDSFNLTTVLCLGPTGVRKY